MDDVMVITTDIVDILKKDTATMLSMKYEELLQKPIPKRDSFTTEEEFKQALINFMLESIDFVSTYKHAAFVLVLNRYNHFLGTMRECEDMKKEYTKVHEEQIAKHVKAQIRTILASLTAAVIVPAGLPIIALLGTTSFAYNHYQTSHHVRSLAMEETLSTMLKDIQNRLFELMDTLRTDYHQSNKELKELQERAKKGENVMPILLEMISPERVALPKISQEEIEEERRLYEALPKLRELLGHSKR